MKRTLLRASVLLLSAASFVNAQQITTPGGSPLIVGNNGLRLSNITSASTPQASNGVALSVNGTGDVILVPAGAGSSGWSASGNNLFSSATGNIGVGTNTPGFKFDLNGDFNLAESSQFRIGGVGFLRKSATSIYFGDNAAGAGTGTTNAANNLFMGGQAGYSITDGKENTFIGNYAGYTNKVGIRNLYLGFRAGVLSTGSNNMFMGAYAGNVNTTGEYNSFIGTGTGAANTTGFWNTYIGGISGFYNNGFGNTAIGYGTLNPPDQSASGINYGTFIGTNAQPSGANIASLTNVTAIGANAKVSASNSVVLGDNANVGIGVTAPTAKLEVKSSAAGSSGLKFTNLTSASPGTIVTATRFLTVDANGNVVLGSTTGGREAASFAENWKLDAATKSLSNSNDGAVVIGQNLLKLPGSYRLFVQEGILTERVKVALRGTDDWSDKVFEPSYKLRSLNEVEQFIKENNHLPGVPSAKDMVKSGNDLHKTDAVLLEKIEELTLYMLELKKENEKLRKEVDQLKQSQQR
ncbi:coiled-coil domain-containing protein [Siphonobacter aquaeclarae]|nr:hypothetical protein [Siphonobacter aquaeclarae]